MAKKILHRNSEGVLMVPIAGRLVPENKLTDAQFLDWLRIMAGLAPLFEGRGRKGTREKAERPTVYDYDHMPEIDEKVWE